MLAVSTDTDTGACTMNQCSGAGAGAAPAAHATKHARQNELVSFIVGGRVPQPGFELGPTHYKAENTETIP